MSAAGFLDVAANGALALLSVAFALVLVRLLRGPSLADRVLALDMLSVLAIGFIAAFGVKTGFDAAVDIAIALGLVGFLATVAFARYILRVPGPGEREGGEDG